ncbi:MFS transporter [Pseudomonas sp. CCNWLW56]|jgi:EmrB/QacA subfamily drug resistance transporter|uniref:MFS transporter n=1 Tax=unclassified Pseudomonas TaxID=196821 RepID=UPI0009539254|nr:MFS transporter [Pseudomonas sp. 7SR1]ROO34842.1 MFS transporter [Pseudomonas sp. 7SR1]SIS25544.1 drug resistance transporter, EmrB/QacA subfamily [Pseudomonas sp. 7SR1]
MKPVNTQQCPPLDTSPRTTAWPRWALSSLALATLLASLGASVAAVALPALAHGLNASFQAVQWVVLAYLLAITTLIVSVGRLGDLLGRRRLLLAGILLFTLASAVCGLAPSLGWLVAGRAFQGLGAAIMMTLTLALVGELVDKDRTGSAMGLLGTLSAVGTALGPSLGGTLIEGFGWQAIFLLNVPLGLLTLLLAWRFLPARASATSTDSIRFDIPGTVLLAMALGAYALAMTQGRGHFDGTHAALLALAALCVGLFIRVQKQAISPLIPLGLLRDRPMVGGLATNALVATVMMATLLVGPFYLAIALGLPATQVGLALAVGPATTALSGVPAGRLVDRFGAGTIRLIGLAIMLLGCVGLTLLSASLGTTGYIATIMVTTVGYALCQTANNTAVMAEIPASRRGVISALLNLSRNLGFFTGASVLGAVFAAALPTNGIGAATAQAVTNGLNFTFAVASLLLVLALGIALRSRVPEPFREVEASPPRQ